MHIHRALFNENVVTPDAIKQCAACVHTLDMLHQVVQQLEFGRADLQLLTLERHAVCSGVQIQVTHRDGIVGSQWGTAAKRCADTSQQLFRREGLGDVVVSPGIQTLYLVSLVSTGCQHQDGNGTRPLLLPPTATQRCSALAGQHPVKQNQIRHLGINFAAGGLGVEHQRGREPTVTQVDRNQFGNGGFVFDHQHAWHVPH